MNILLTDDHTLFRDGLRLLLAGLDPNARFLQASSCEEALSVDPGEPDLVLVDLKLPDGSGVATLQRVKAHFDGCAVVVVSGEESPDLIRRCISEGASGFIPKASDTDILLAALRLVIAGGTYLPPIVLDNVKGAGDEEAADILNAIDTLSERQKNILAKAIQGKLNKVIAAELQIAEGTVKAHLSAAFKALGVRNRTEAVYLATRLGLDVGTAPD